MPRMVARVLNIGSLQGKIKKLGCDMQAGAIMGLRNLADPIKEDVQQSIRTGPRSGRWVKRYHPERLHKASAPGEVPANDLGMLAASVEAEVDPVQFNLVLSANAPYARALELGTSKMLPRPFLRPALARWRGRIVDALQAAIRRSI